MTRRTKNDAAWTTKAQLRVMLGLSESGLDKVRRAIGNSHEERRGQQVRIYLPDWLRAWARYTSGVLDDEGSTSANVSIYLEQKRKYEALLVRDKYLRERGQLVPEQDVFAGYHRVATHLRQASESMCASCKLLMDTALVDADKELEQAQNDQDGARSPAE